jgi:hypothetical protein
MSDNPQKRTLPAYPPPQGVFWSDVGSADTMVVNWHIHPTDALVAEFATHGQRTWSGEQLVEMVGDAMWATNIRSADLLAAVQTMSHTPQGLSADIDATVWRSVLFPSMVAGWAGQVPYTQERHMVRAALVLLTYATQRGMARLAEKISGLKADVITLARHRLDSQMLVRPMKMAKDGTLFDGTAEVVQRISQHLPERIDDGLSEIERNTALLNGEDLPERTQMTYRSDIYWSMTTDEQLVDAELAEQFAQRGYPAAIVIDSMADLLAAMRWSDNPHNRSRLKAALNGLTTVMHTSVYKYKYTTKKGKDRWTWWARRDTAWRIGVGMQTENRHAIHIEGTPSLYHQMTPTHGGKWYIQVPADRVAALERSAGSSVMTADALQVHSRLLLDAHKARPDATLPAGQGQLAYTIKSWCEQWSGGRVVVPQTQIPIGEDEAITEKIRQLFIEAADRGDKPPTDRQLADELGLSLQKAGTLRIRAGIVKYKGRKLRPAEVRTRLVNALEAVKQTYPALLVAFRAPPRSGVIDVVINIPRKVATTDAER